MSAFMVTQATMQAIVGAMDQSLSDAQRTAKGRELFAMNTRALRARYGDDAVAPKSQVLHSFQWQEPEFVYNPALNQSAVTSYKALSCFLYQCGEGDEPDSGLYQAMEAISNSLAHSLARSLPGYAAAPWDIPDSESDSNPGPGGCYAAAPGAA
jgi:hypothetical protein